MTDLKPHAEATRRFKPFVEEILKPDAQKIHSIHVTGSALSTDYDPKHSDINSVLVLNQMDLKFLEILAPLGKKFGKKRVAAPLIMTPEYVRQSLDVFPIEFLNIRLLHYTWQGEDIFQDIDILTSDLRRQCERELKVRLIGLRQGYIAAAGDRRILSAEFLKAFGGYIPLFRGIIVLHQKETPIAGSDVLSTLEDVSSIAMDPFRAVLKAKKERAKLSMEQLNTLFEDCYSIIEKLGKVIDEIQA